MKVLNHQIAYAPKLSDFERVRKSPQRSAIGGNSPRFEYYSSRRKQGALPSAQSYAGHNISTSRGAKAFLNQPSGRAFSFGESRHRMQKIHIDAILDPSAIKKVNNPGPGQHALAFDWVRPKDS